MFQFGPERCETGAEVDLLHATKVGGVSLQPSESSVG
jgi:hypothetical protein